MEARLVHVDYQEMIDLLNDLDEKFEEYDSRCKEIRRKDDEEQKAIENSHQKQEKQLRDTSEREKQEAKNRREGWSQKIGSYASAVDSTREKVRSALSIAATYGVGENGNTDEEKSVSMLKNESSMLQAKKMEDDNIRILQMYKSSQRLYNTLQREMKQLSTVVDKQYQKEVQHSEEHCAQACAANDKAQQSSLEACQRKKINRLRRAQETLQENVKDELRPQEQAKRYDELKRTIPNGEVFRPAEHFPEGICLGYAEYNAEEHFSDETKAAILASQFAFAMEKSETRHSLAVPYGHNFTDPKLSTMLVYDTQSRSQVIDILRSMVMQLFMAIPCGKVRFTFVDPVDLGNTFAMFSRLGEIDERIIDTRIWSGEDRIEERLQVVVDHTEDVIQRCLQGRFKNIVEYNHSAGKNAEPMRFVVVMDFPKHFSQKALDRLESITSKGPQNGVFTILAINKDDLESPACPPEIQHIAAQMNQIFCLDGKMYMDEKVGGKPLIYQPIPLPSGEKVQHCIDALRRGIQESERIVITYNDVSENLLERPDYWFHFDARNGISIPIGLEGANRPVMLQLGGVNKGGKKKPFHAMVGGTIGSGKSSLLHTIITGILLHYSPEDVQLYVLDFKRGIEFKSYADARLQNFRSIAIDTEPEFGLAVLQSLVEEEKKRSSRFREENVDRIEAYRERMAEKGIVHHDMPRLVVVFDEYQELFRDADDPMVRECARILSQVVLQAGSAMGIHIILATQDVSNVHGLDPALYAQFETRIALKCNEETSKTILSADNEAASQLVTADAGQAVFNDAAGHKDYNHMFRVAFIPLEERECILNRIHDAQAAMFNTTIAPARLLLSSVQDDPDNVLNRFSESGSVDVDTEPASRLFIGESLSMINTFQPKLWVRQDQNFLLVGRNQEKASKACAFAAMSLLYETIRQEGAITRPVITIFNFEGRNSVREDTPLKHICAAIPEAFEVVDNDNMVNALQILQQQLEDNDRHYVIFFGLNRARRLLQASSRYDQLPREILVDLLRRGPDNGMHFLVWANDPALYLNDYGDTLDLFEYRLGFNMEPSEYEATISYIARQGKDGETKEEGVLSAIAFDINDENQKIRLYDTPTKDWMNNFIENCKKYVR